MWKKALENKVAVVPGTAFGKGGEGFIRASYCYSTEHIKEALHRIGEFLNELKIFYNELKKGNDITKDVKVTSNINKDKEGNYEVLYSIGNVNKVRFVTVEEMVDETFIYLKGEVNALYLELGEKYNKATSTIAYLYDKALKKFKKGIK